VHAVIETLRGGLQHRLLGGRLTCWKLEGGEPAIGRRALQDVAVVLDEELPAVEEETLQIGKARAQYAARRDV
jgi:hypothetical protein